MKHKLKVLDVVIANESDFSLTKDKEYEIYKIKSMFSIPDGIYAYIKDDNGRVYDVIDGNGEELCSWITLKEVNFSQMSKGSSYIAVHLQNPSDNEYLQKKAQALGWITTSSYDYEVLYIKTYTIHNSHGNLEYVRSIKRGHKDYILDFTKDFLFIMEWLESNAPNKVIEIVEGGKYYAELSKEQYQKLWDNTNYYDKDKRLVANCYSSGETSGWMPIGSDKYWKDKGYTKITPEQFIKHFEPKPLKIQGHEVEVRKDEVVIGCKHIPLKEIETIKKIVELNKEIDKEVFVYDNGAVNYEGENVLANDVKKLIKYIDANK